MTSDHKSTKAKKSPKQGAEKKDMLARIFALPQWVLISVPVAVFAVLYLFFMAFSGSPATSQRVAQQQRQPAVQEEQATAPQPATAEQGTQPQPDANGPTEEEQNNVPDYVGPQNDVSAVAESTLPTLPRRMEGIKKLGREVKMTQEEFSEQSDVFDAQKLQGDIFLAYALRLPKGWTALAQADLKSQQLSANLAGLLAYYLSPVQFGERSSFRVVAKVTPYHLTARDLLDQYMRENRYTPQALSDYGDTRSEALYVKTENDASYVVRLAVLTNGPRVVYGEYLVPFNQYEANKELQTWSIAGFYLKNRDPARAERITKLSFYDIAQADYPASWVIRGQSMDDLTRMKQSIINQHQSEGKASPILQGRLDVIIMTHDRAGTTEMAAIDYINGFFGVNNLMPGPPIGKFDIPENKNGLVPVNAQAYDLTNLEGRKQNYVYWLTTLRGKERDYYVGLLTMPMDVDPANWARNISTYDMVISTLREDIE